MKTSRIMKFSAILESKIWLKTFAYMPGSVAGFHLVGDAVIDEPFSPPGNGDGTPYENAVRLSVHNNVMVMKIPGRKSPLNAPDLYSYNVIHHHVAVYELHHLSREYFSVRGGLLVGGNFGCLRLVKGFG